MKYKSLLSLLLLWSVSAFAQQSTNYKLEEHVLNAGGSPEAGAVLSSSGFRITLSSLGDGLLSLALSSSSFQLHGGFVGGHPPAGEVMNLLFSDQTTLDWDPEPSVGTYNLYRDLMSNLAAMGYGNCQQQGLSATTTQYTDNVTLGDGFFYLVTAETSLQQEGPKGFQSAGGPRLGPTCP